MAAPLTVLLLGATGRTGRLVLEQLLARDVRVRAIVRSASRLPADRTNDPRLTVIEAELLALGDDAWTEHVRGCDAVVSCLGHTISLKGVFGPPRDLVVQAVARACRAIRSTKPGAPVKLVLMTSVSVNHPGEREPHRTAAEHALLGVLRALVPPTHDNQAAADWLHEQIGENDAYVQWVVVRPDTLQDGDVAPYALHEHLAGSLFKPDDTNRANVAHFMCELVTDPATWNRWQGRLPVIANEVAARA